MSERQSGKVVWFDKHKAFGFIKPDNGIADLFVHYTQIQMDGFKVLEDGQRVEFTVGSILEGKNAGKPQAENVVPLEKAGEEANGNSATRT